MFRSGVRNLADLADLTDRIDRIELRTKSLTTALPDVDRRLSTLHQELSTQSADLKALDSELELQNGPEMMTTTSAATIDRVEYIVYKDVDIVGNDVQNAPTIDARSTCSKMKHCVAFNHMGWMKSSLSVRRISG